MPPKIASNQACKLADYSQKEIQRQDECANLYVTRKSAGKYRSSKIHIYVKIADTLQP
jgi:hypothetical protein